ncbi:MAG: hypothetical protein ACRCVA_26800 [Phreatobacter sp.]
MTWWLADTGRSFPHARADIPVRMFVGAFNRHAAAMATGTWGRLSAESNSIGTETISVALETAAYRGSLVLS